MILSKVFELINDERRIEQNRLFTEICSQYKTPNSSITDHVLFHDCELKPDVYVDQLSEPNHASCAFDEVFMGKFDDYQKRAIAFFHEIGHIDDWQSGRLGDQKDWPYNHFFEAQAWRTGIRIAGEYGFTFSEDTIEYAKESLSTYFQENPPNGEKTDIKWLPQAIEHAFV